MNAAVKRVKANPEYVTSGEVYDGLYNRFNLFLYNSGSSLMHGMILVLMHTTQSTLYGWKVRVCMFVLCVHIFLQGSTRRIVGIATLSRPEHRVAQTREVACTKIVLPQVIARGLCYYLKYLHMHICIQFLM